jgi:hypothetical protein
MPEPGPDKGAEQPCSYPGGQPARGGKTSLEYSENVVLANSGLQFGESTSTVLGHAVAQFVEALRYKSEGRGFDSRRCRKFSLTESFRPHYGLGVDSASKRNEYQESFLGVKAAAA